jgi:hypothetical protein
MQLPCQKPLQIIPVQCQPDNRRELLFELNIVAASILARRRHLAIERKFPQLKGDRRASWPHNYSAVGRWALIVGVTNR